jgi:hypothetical protein
MYGDIIAIFEVFIPSLLKLAVLLFNYKTQCFGKIQYLKKDPYIAYKVVSIVPLIIT